MRATITNRLIVAFLFCLGLCSGMYVWDSHVHTAFDEPASLIMRRSRKPLLRKLVLAQCNEKDVEGIFLNGDTLAAALSRHKVPSSVIQELVDEIDDQIDLSKIRSGAPFKLTYSIDTDELQSIELRINLREYLYASLRDDGEWLVEIIPFQVEHTIQSSEGIIENSFWNSAVQAELPPALIMDMADLFGCEVDFTSDLRTNDSFKVFYSLDIYVTGEKDPSDIVAARFTNKDKTFYMFQFTLPDGSVDYYDENGESVRHSFLKSPLRFRYISSGFSMSRVHPILKIPRPHLGVDYAAPAGTPVSALGDGIVMFAGTKGGYGNFIELKHGDQYETCYAHLSRFAKGIRVGAKVKQGQIIGYVGSTGLSTGPHLDFRVRYKGKFINPLNLPNRPSYPIPEDCRPAFMDFRDTWMDKLHSES